jgi:hypothetical protein
MPMVIQPLWELPTLAILLFAQTAKSLWSIFSGYGSSCTCCAAVGISQLSQRDMPMEKNLPDLENQFLQQWMLFCTDRSFETGGF